MDPIFRRIDYIRQTKSIPRNGLNAPPGVNPYVDEFGVLAESEIRRLILKHVKQERKAGVTVGRPISLSNIGTEAGISNGKGNHLTGIRAIRDGRPHTMGRKWLRQLSRVLLMLESGQLVKRDGKMVYLPYDEATAPRPMTMYRVCLGPDGRATITRGEPLPAPKQMPKLFADFKLPGA